MFSKRSIPLFLLALLSGCSLRLNDNVTKQTTNVSTGGCLSKAGDVLDHYEGVAGGHYLRAPLRVFRPAFGDAVEAVVYLAQGVADAPLTPPRFYLDHLLAGRDLLPLDYVSRLEAFATLPIFSEL